MGYQAPEKFSDVSVVCKANIYFEGRVVSHSLEFGDGSRKTIGLIYPGEYRFNTDAAERMEIIAGACRVRVSGQNEWVEFAAGTFFDVPQKSYFEIAVDAGIAEYVCSFL